MESLLPWWSQRSRKNFDGHTRRQTLWTRSRLQNGGKLPKKSKENRQWRGPEEITRLCIGFRPRGLIFHFILVANSCFATTAKKLLWFRDRNKSGKLSTSKSPRILKAACVRNGIVLCELRARPVSPPARSNFLWARPAWGPKVKARRPGGLLKAKKCLNGEPDWKFQSSI